ncbi:GNAT family N-acetyltransferase [Aeromonas caviae]|uniref:GNAT family N-acetyltransferase n=1 Tax=Aeromonas caviae TaxID=648 RepID=UPI002B496E4E|nr:GNAT family N-acetyltransferase [Aeromonas caviae]
MTIDELKALLDTDEIKPDFTKAASHGYIKNSNNDNVKYEIFVGWDLAMANQCDKMWGYFNTELIQFIVDKSYSEEELRTIESYIQLSDSHWNWLTKSCVYKSEEYKWFYLYAEDKPQAACLIYHPKESVLHDGKIFYIEYIAVAPWNRKNPMRDRDLIGLGKVMIQFAMRYASVTLGLQLGFSLHSLPTATGFYESLGMLHYEQHDKDMLKFYEMPPALVDQYLEAS